MNIFRDLAKLPAFHNAVITTGSFDGVHIGHQKIFAKIRQLAANLQGESVVVTFDPHPRQVIYPKDTSLRLLTTIDEKLSYFRKYGVDNAVILPFTVEFSQLGPREYVEKFLLGRFKPKCMVLGYDHRFGLNRAGDFDLLQSYAENNDFQLVRIDEQEINDITISSTRIRVALGLGDVRTANALLGHPYLMRGTVVHGNKIGQKMGYPTANLRVPVNNKLLPKSGVYAARAHLAGEQYDGMLYIGTRPSLSAKRDISIEIHLFDFTGEIYGEHIDVELIDYVRDDMVLADLRALRAQIDEDRKAVRDILRRVDRASEPHTAVVALNYNGREVLEKYLPSFSHHGDTATTTYVADNKSDDDSVPFVRSQFPGIRVIQLDKNYGFAAGYNRALDGLEEKYIALVNTDIELTKGWLDPIISILEQNPDVAVCQPKIRDAKNRRMFEYAGACGGFIDALGYPFCIGRILNDIEEDRGQYNHTREIFWSSGAAFVIRRELFEQAGGFDSDYFAHQEEIDLCWTLKRAGYRIMVVPQSIVYHEGGATLPYNNPRKVFLNFRNNIATMVKQLPGWRLILTLPVRLILDLLACINFLTQLKFRNALAVIQAYGALLLWLPRLLQKRYALNERLRNIRIGPPTTEGWMQGSILMHYYFFAHRVFSQIMPSQHVQGKKA